jgi:general secretion pathway protein B
MSFILDALKKSEHERQRHIGPSLADVQVHRRERERPWWVAAVAGLLVVNIGVLAVVLMRDPAEPQGPVAAPAPSTAPPAQPAMRTAPSAPPPARPAPQDQQSAGDPSVRSLAAEAGVPATDAAFAEEAAPTPDPGAATAPSLVRRIEPGSAGAAERPQAPPVEAPAEVLPTLDDVTASGTALPELHLDIHVSSSNPAERFVFVNMRKYVEGQTLNEGPAVERITTDGVILNHRGLRFLLPRQ